MCCLAPSKHTISAEELNRVKAEFNNAFPTFGSTLVAAGRGVVLAVTHHESILSSLVVAQHLRDLGCSLPGEVWSVALQGSYPAAEAMLGALGFRLIEVGDDLSPAVFPIAAARHSQFADVLILDAYTLPATDPTYLLESEAFLCFGGLAWRSGAPISFDPGLCEIVGAPPCCGFRLCTEAMLISKDSLIGSLDAAIWLARNSNLPLTTEESLRFALYKFGVDIVIGRESTSLSAPSGGTCTGVLCLCDDAGDRVFQIRKGPHNGVRGPEPYIAGVYYEARYHFLYRKFQTELSRHRLLPAQLQSSAPVAKETPPPSFVSANASENGELHIAVPVQHLIITNSSSDASHHISAMYALAAAAKRGIRITFVTGFREWLLRVEQPGVNIVAANAEQTLTSFDLNRDVTDQLRLAESRASWYAAAVWRGLKPTRPSRVNSHVQASRIPFAPYVVLSPFTPRSSAAWPASHWKRLIALLQLRGTEVVVTMPPEGVAAASEIWESTGTFCAAWPNVEWLNDTLLDARAVIGVDSVVIHLAGLLGVPTVAIHSDFSGAFLWECTDVVSLTPDAKCVSCRLQTEHGYLQVCEGSCSAIAAVTPDRVIDALAHLHEANAA
jgi:hypothetical protein